MRLGAGRDDRRRGGGEVAAGLKKFLDLQGGGVVSLQSQ